MVSPRFGGDVAAGASGICSEAAQNRRGCALTPHGINAGSGAGGWFSGNQPSLRRASTSVGPTWRRPEVFSLNLTVGGYTPHCARRAPAGFVDSSHCPRNPSVGAAGRSLSPFNCEARVNTPMCVSSLRLADARIPAPPPVPPQVALINSFVTAPAGYGSNHLSHASASTFAYGQSLVGSTPDSKASFSARMSSMTSALSAIQAQVRGLSPPAPVRSSTPSFFSAALPATLAISDERAVQAAKAYVLPAPTRTTDQPSKSVEEPRCRSSRSTSATRSPSSSPPRARAAGLEEVGATPACFSLGRFSEEEFLNSRRIRPSGNRKDEAAQTFQAVDVAVRAAMEAASQCQSRLSAAGDENIGASLSVGASTALRGSYCFRPGITIRPIRSSNTTTPSRIPTWRGSRGAASPGRPAPDGPRSKPLRGSRPQADSRQNPVERNREHRCRPGSASPAPNRRPSSLAAARQRHKEQVAATDRQANFSRDMLQRLDRIRQCTSGRTASKPSPAFAWAGDLSKELPRSNGQLARGR